MQDFFLGLLVGMGIVLALALVMFLFLVVEERKKRIARERSRIKSEL
jgi:hypothetical protein